MFRMIHRRKIEKSGLNSYFNAMPYKDFFMNKRASQRMALVAKIESHELPIPPKMLQKRLTKLKKVEEDFFWEAKNINLKTIAPLLVPEQSRIFPKTPAQLDHYI